MSSLSSQRANLFRLCTLLLKVQNYYSSSPVDGACKNFLMKFCTFLLLWVINWLRPTESLHQKTLLWSQYYPSKLAGPGSVLSELNKLVICNFVLYGQKLTNLNFWFLRHRLMRKILMGYTLELVGFFSKKYTYKFEPCVDFIMVKSWAQDHFRYPPPPKKKDLLISMA